MGLLETVLQRRFDGIYGSRQTASSMGERASGKSSAAYTTIVRSYIIVSLTLSIVSMKHSPCRSANCLTIIAGHGAVTLQLHMKMICSNDLA